VWHLQALRCNNFLTSAADCCCYCHLQILDETSAAVAALEAQQWRASTERSLDYARSLAAKTAVAISGAAAAAGMQDVTVTSSALLPEGGASDVGASVCKYAQEHKVRVNMDVVVCAGVVHCTGATCLRCRKILD
jgi:hypothetical protein